MPELDNILQQLRAEREHSQAQLHKLDQAIAALEGVGSAKSVGRTRGRRTLSTQARHRIAEAQRRRWAKARKKGPPKAAGTRRKLSPAARARIAAAQKARWAKFRAQQKRH
jgi:hypothetical protein